MRRGSVRATRQDGSYPRPMLCRPRWVSLDGRWDFATDDADIGRSARWFSGAVDAPFDRQIEVPYPPESPASGIGDAAFHPVLWYRRALHPDDLPRLPAHGGRLLLHFGAVDYEAEVWVDGHRVGSHVGGQSPFTVDITEALSLDSDQHVLVVRTEDDPADVEQPRGKQDWKDEPHGIWYRRTSGIWQTVWAEAVGAQHLAELAWTCDIPAANVHGELILARPPAAGLEAELTLRLDDQVLARQTVLCTARTVSVTLSVPRMRNGQDRSGLLWSPDEPVLLDVEIVLHDTSSGAVLDEVASYVGLRSVAVGGGALLLNGHPYYLRAVLDQGYRPQTHLASTGTDELRAEVEVIRELGFNAVRIHQKAEDPRFLYWADRLGLLVWGETAAAYAYSPRGVSLLVGEWSELVRRDRSHPCIAVWVPLNESWGIQDVATSSAQRSFARALAELTRSLDPTRPVMSNEGWEHVDSDIFGVHDYTTDPQQLRERWSTTTSAAHAGAVGFGPEGRRLALTDTQRATIERGDAPLIITEFGGISLHTPDGAWGYATIRSPEHYASLLRELFDAIRSAPAVAGFCYTQLLDTGQETNGLLSADRSPKLAMPELRRIVTGSDKDG